MLTARRVRRKSMMETISASSPTPIKSEIFAAASLIFISITVLLLLRYYLPLRTTPAYLSVPVFLALWLPATIVLLVPIDLASSAMADAVDARGIWLQPALLKVCWRISYWLTFALTWFILPVLAEFSDSGYRNPKARVLDSLRANAQYYAIVFGCGVSGLLYVLFTYGTLSGSLKSTIMALAYCWGLMLAIYLMGHGLVAIPRRLLRNANINDKLYRIQSQAPKLYEHMVEAEMKLEDIQVTVSELSRRKTGMAADLSEWIDELMDFASLPEAQPRLRAVGPSRDENRILPRVLTDKFMADLTRQFARARQARSRYRSEWNSLLQDAIETQAIIDSAASKQLDFGNVSPHAGVWEKMQIHTPYTRHLFYYYWLPYTYVLLGGMLATASACIVWSELVKGLLPSLSLIRYSVIHHWKGDKGQVGFAGQVVAALCMLYMCAAAFTSITEVKVWRGRALVRRNTAPESAFWYSSQVARLSVPLSYNFMTLLGSKYRHTVFYDFLGQLINLTPLGKWFDYLFPAFVLLPVCATLFGLYGKVKRLFGFGVDVIEDVEEDEFGSGTYGSGSWREGRDLIERELNGTSAAMRGPRSSTSPLAGAAPDNRRGRNAPLLTVPGSNARAGCPTTPLGTWPNTRPQANTSVRRAGARSLPESEDETFLAALRHRMRNTIDTFDAPNWLQHLGQGMRKPKWIGVDEDEARRRTSIPEGVRSEAWGWLGGNQGQIRL